MSRRQGVKEREKGWRGGERDLIFVSLSHENLFPLHYYSFCNARIKTDRLISKIILKDCDILRIQADFTILCFIIWYGE